MSAGDDNIPDDVDAEPDLETEEEADDTEEDVEEEESDPDDEVAEEAEPEEEPLPPAVEAALRRRDPTREARQAAVAASPKRTPAKKVLARPKKASEYEVQQRRKDVLRLRMRGHSYGDIAAKLAISVNTVKNDLTAVREENEHAVKSFSQAHFVGETMVVYDDIIARAWEEYFACPAGAKNRITAMDLIRATQGDKFKALMDVGLIDKKEQEVKHRHVHEMPWDDSLQQQVIQGMIERSLTPQLAAPTFDPNHGPGKNIEEAEIVVTPTPAPPEEQLTSLAQEKLSARDDRVYRSMVSHGMSPEDARAAIAKSKKQPAEGDTT